MTKKTFELNRIFHLQFFSWKNYDTNDRLQDILQIWKTNSQQNMHETWKSSMLEQAEKLGLIKYVTCTIGREFDDQTMKNYFIYVLQLFFCSQFLGVVNLTKILTKVLQYIFGYWFQVLIWSICTLIPCFI